MFQQLWKRSLEVIVKPPLFFYLLMISLRVMPLVMNYTNGLHVKRMKHFGTSKIVHSHSQ